MTNMTSAATLPGVSGPLDLGPAAFPAATPYRGTSDELVYESLCFRVVEGYRPLFCDVHVPRPATPGEGAPLIVWVHGGGWTQGSRRRFPVGLEQNWLLERMLMAGFAVARVDYRLGLEASFPAPVEDVAAAVEWLTGHSEPLGVDPNRIVIWGESAGAHIAMLVAARRPAGGRLRAVVDWYGPIGIDAPEGDVASSPVPGGEIAGGEIAGGENSGQDPAAVLRAQGWDAPEASLLHAVGKDLPPTFIAHGRDDQLVPPEQSRRLRDRLAGLNVPVEYVETDGGHVFAGSSAIPEVIGTTLGFLGRHLGLELGPRPDPELASNLARLEGLPGDPFGTDDPVEARRRLSGFMAQVQSLREYPVATVRDVPLSLGDRTLGLRIQTPIRHTDTLLLYVHGGGWVVGDLDTHQRQAARIGATLPAVVVQLDYRRAPEHPFPAALEDTMAAIEWCQAHLEELGATRLVLGGDSAGGNLVFAAAQLCRDRAVPIPIAGILANYPAVDLSQGRERGLPATYLGGDITIGSDPRVSPTLGALEGLPPIVIGVGGLDFLLEDILAFVYKARAAGVSVTLRIFPSLAHGFFSSAPLSVAADRASEMICQDFARMLWETRAPSDCRLPTEPADTTIIA